MFDVLIIGGGHAGIEAAQIASQFNLSVGLISIPGIPLGSAPCNPSVGGVGKGQVVREIDALGGIMGILADKSGIQYRTLNESKGYAVQSTRVQIDKDLYASNAEALLSGIKNLTIIRDVVSSCESLDGIFVVNSDTRSYRTKKLIMTVGTFLNGKMHVGPEQTLGGRVGCASSNGLSELFSAFKSRKLRFKTGTPPRLKRSSINLSKLEEQPSDDSVRNFHCLSNPFNRSSPQVSCYLAHTNEKTMSIIRDNKESSPMYNGQISGVGARYCPSIEDKAYRYPDKNVHHVFIEPESLTSETMYPSGISSSLPKHVQKDYVNSIEGLETAEIEVFGYAVEYDVIDTTMLDLTLECRDVKGLYFAGQVNGTSGYEEAAGQGFVAGVNAALSVLSKGPFILSRHDSYIGVMIEDLVSNLRDEPYRLFTARSENRLYLREDNTLLRMLDYRKSLELDLGIDRFLSKYLSEYSILSEFVRENTLSFGYLNQNNIISSSKFINPPDRISIPEVLRQADIDPVRALTHILDIFKISISFDVTKSVAIDIKYEGYIKRSEVHNNKIKKLDLMKINWEDLTSSSNISFECKQRIAKIKPQTFGQLRLIDGIRPATLAVVASRSV